jgi:hypothetical protein
MGIGQNRAGIRDSVNTTDKYQDERDNGFSGPIN